LVLLLKLLGSCCTQIINLKRQNLVHKKKAGRFDPPLVCAISCTEKSNSPPKKPLPLLLAIGLLPPAAGTAWPQGVSGHIFRIDVSVKAERLCCMATRLLGLAWIALRDC
jgi:hypothetical protein